MNKQFAKPLAVLDKPMPWKANTASDQLVIKYKDFVSFCSNADAEYEHLEYNMENILQPLDGFYMIVHNPDEFPVNIGSQNIELKTVTSFVSITPEMFLLDDDLKSWPVEKRNCYLAGERNLTFFKIYTQANCEHECLSQTFQEKCGCVPFYLIGQLLHNFRKMVFRTFFKCSRKPIK